MSDNKNLTIGILSVSAVVLLAALIVTTAMPQPVMALGQLDRGGDYILMTSQFTENSEVVFVTDAAARRMIMYSYEPTTRDIRFWDAIDLGKTLGGGGD